ncbi:glycosyltransferase family 61 protein [Hymenobacter cheonanensis]|uniref:glycosyltransferase family 61 protein n=1 Tax=Hymenobacter sp. CA2-7 TaxID=3063993 RepID=UPI0027140966|nr:glycosyltransferase family 61 protein [Hymenobacter sp. CA2-7]MDO7884402.1 glycosyltransferase family 61 protein [Hymenobacter sp. CA2-7]
MPTLSSVIHRVSRLIPQQIESQSWDVKKEENPITYTLPKNYNELPENLKYYYKLTTKIDATKAFILNNVFVYQGGMVFKGLKFFVPSLPEKWLIDHVKYDILVAQWVSKKKYIVENEVALIFDQWSSVNYYHWIIDSLPRLLLLRDSFPNCKVILPYPTSSYIVKTASLLGFKDFLFVKNQELVHFKKLILIGHTSPPKFHSTLMIRRLRDELLQAVHINQVSNKRKLYISRSKQTVRRLLNESEILPILKKYNFEIITFEGMSFEDQVQIINTSEIIVSTHGANLTNILFATPGATVIEMHNKRTDNFLYFRLCTNLNLNYYSVPCEASQYVDNDGDLEVNIEYLESVIVRAIENTSST